MTVAVESDKAQQEAWRKLQLLNRRLLAEPSATAVLERWCGGPCGPQRIEVRKRAQPARTLPEGLRQRLDAGADELIEYRRVALMYGGVTVSEAENWYCPARVAADMQHALEHSDQPFGRVVQALGFARETLCVDWLWQPGEHARGEWPQAVLRHQAILRRADGLPFSAVIETYARAVLSFGGLT
ncbi:hypothetical protein [Frateuria aurantia]|uniref:4-hydroxybenzoate synthetase (Chorismate lyase) n=1 Tax=Frateuria aurantia (strain ATCC 33424 / DSM 6220 / KCTC 2777 / LMG 1558 / NBRC 3245 / NCIMB 13370) TaxID=767434 RepID=H8L2D9_FRAAD|nr:hypothetical protein [Frateuria aurantia]AFC84773.1 hypothetical protein Fraau_0280 [Frateuria aurantia DSM 6220]